MQKNILLCEDDRFLREGLCEILEKEFYAVTAVETVQKAKEALQNRTFDLLIFDVMLPDGDGFSLCESVREKDSKTPILFLTACDDEIQVVRGLDAGADDYVTKPFRMLELLSRVRALLRRTATTQYKTQGLFVDLEKMQVQKDGETLFLTPTEFKILSTLIRNQGTIVTRKILLSNIWDDSGNFIDDNTLSVHISRLREKIGAKHIVTVCGVGYRWEERA